MIFPDHYLNLSDAELVHITLKGDKGAFSELVSRYQDPIVRYCMRILNYNQQDGEDAASEAFLCAYKYLASYNNSYKFSSWLYRIAHNQAVNIIKKNSRFFTVDLEAMFQIPMPSKEIATEFTNDDLEQVLSNLKFKDRNILTLFYLEEKSLQEISDILKLTSNTVAQRLSRARKKAQTIIQTSN